MSRKKTFCLQIYLQAQLQQAIVNVLNGVTAADLQQPYLGSGCVRSVY